MNKIKVALVDDDHGWLKALTSFLNNEDDIMVVSTAITKDEAINLAKTVAIDIFLVDINLDGNKLDGIEVAAAIQDVSKARVIMLTCLKEEHIVTDSFEAGAAQFVSKEDYEDIPRLIRRVYDKAFSPIEILAQKYTQIKRDDQLKCLTPAERRVYGLIEQGYTRTQIESILMITNNTLKTQIRQVLKKLKANSSKEVLKNLNRK